MTHWDPTKGRRYTAIWQSHAPKEREWIDEIMGPYITEHVTDGKHQVVLDDAILLDAFTYCHDPAYYARFRDKNAFLVSFLDETFEGGYGVYENFCGVFRCFWSSAFDRPAIMRMPLGYCNGARAANRLIAKASERTYVWSFLGSTKKSTRPEMLRELASIEPHFLFATEPNPGMATSSSPTDERKRLSRQQFSRLLLDSAFSPCPMGNVNIESYRVYESLECGAIPIVEKRLTLDYYRELLGNHPMPTVRSWAEARRFISMMTRKPAELDALQQRCTTWWSQYKLDYTALLGEFLAKWSSVPSENRLRPRVSEIHKFPGWGVAELLRHHDARAIARRFQKQVIRLVKDRKVRETHRPGTRLN